ncbi:MAG: hypothetical protein JWM81_414 [Candidatus Saccharibacteria bacterium]|nr:hypothetical protein [Candidatus Saccharibacteria bacterium]
MTFSVNGQETLPVDPQRLLGVELPEIQTPLTVTYLAAVHKDRRDFDPSWDRVIAEADTVLHEEAGWRPENRLALNRVANGTSKDARMWAPDTKSYFRRRLDAITGTRVTQGFWDVSASQMQELGLSDMLNSYHAKYVEAEDLLKQGDTDTALDVMASAHMQLATYDTARDSIGLQTVADTLKDIGQDKSDEPAKIVVMAGLAHVYQAAALSRKLSGQAQDVRVKSLITNPFGVGHISYARYLSHEDSTREETAKQWLINLLHQHEAAKSSYLSATNIFNAVQAKVESISDDEAVATLLRTAKP